MDLEQTYQTLVKLGYKRRLGIITAYKNGILTEEEYNGMRELLKDYCSWLSILIREDLNPSNRYH